MPTQPCNCIEETSERIKHIEGLHYKQRSGTPLPPLLRGRKQRHREFSVRLNSLPPDLLQKLNYKIMPSGAIKRTDRNRRGQRITRHVMSAYKKAKGKREFLDAKSHRAGSNWMI